MQMNRRHALVWLAGAAGSAWAQPAASDPERYRPQAVAFGFAGGGLFEARGSTSSRRCAQEATRRA